MKLFKISWEEKKVQLIYLMLLWLGLSAVFSMIFLKDYPVTPILGKEIVMDEISERKSVAAEYSLNMRHVDSLRLHLEAFNPEIRQISLENRIQQELEEIKQAYQNKKDHSSYKIYMQVADYYSMLFYDKQAISNAVSNAGFLKKNLEDCEIGFQQAQNNINLQEALKNNTRIP